MTLFVELVRASQRVGAAAGRLVKVRELGDFLAGLAVDEVAIAAHYLSGEIPQGRIGIGYAALRSAAAAAGAAAESLSIGAVHGRMEELVAVRGAGSTARRATALRALFGLATPAEQDFLLRLLAGELRQGAAAGVMIDALAAAANLPPAQVRRAVMYAPNIGAVAEAALHGGTAALEHFQLQLFSPVVPMLAQTAADVDEALEILPGDVAFEWKMDGARIQVHRQGDNVRIYTRGLNEVTDAVPEVVALVRCFAVDDFVLDGEAIAIDASGRPHPFQITMRRFGRKREVDAVRGAVPMHAFFFDCLRSDGRTRTDQPLRARIDVLNAIVPADAQMPRLTQPDAVQARRFYDAALAAGHEGVMAKSLDSIYEAGNRGASWLKIKRAHTLDLVVLAAEWGHGRRSGKLSNLHLGARDPATGEYVMLGKTFKGLTDAMLQWQTREFLAREMRRDDWIVYVRPELVVEIAFSDLQESKRYPGKLALRLARVKRYREDKTAAEADDMDSVRRIFAAQGGAAP